MIRREFIKNTAVGLTALAALEMILAVYESHRLNAPVGLTALAAGRPHGADAKGSKYRVAVIGRTGRGEYVSRSVRVEKLTCTCATCGEVTTGAGTAMPAVIWDPTFVGSFSHPGSNRSRRP